MGELPSDIRAILEALARKEITVDEAEALINALRQARDAQERASQKRRKRGLSVIGKEITVKEGEEVTGDVEVVNGTAVVKGRIVGELRAVFSDVYFAGEVTGDADFIGCKVKWDGGTIGGDLQLIGSEYSGRKPYVKGSVNEINNLFVSGVLGTVKLFVKPLLSGIKLEN